MKAISKINDVLNVELYPYQLEGVEFMQKHHYCILGDEMGLGKTLQALALHLLVDKPTLIVVPAYLRETWANEIDKYVDTWVDVAVFKNYDDIRPPKHEDIIIVSYNMLIHCENLFEWADLVIADECHYLKNEECSRGMIFHKFLYENMPERFVGLSGTPIKNGVVEWYSPLTLCSYTPNSTNGKNVKKAFPEKKIWCRLFAFSRMISIGSGRYVEKYSGLRNRDKLKEYLKGKYLRRKSEDVLDLPDFIRKDIIVDYRSDKGLEADWHSHQSGKQVDSSSKAESALVKAAFTARYCKDLFEGEGTPILIYTTHVESAERLGEKLDCSVITGKTPMEERNRLAKLFQLGNLPYLVATIGSFSTGYTLTASNNVVFNDLSWVPADNWQAEKRIHRIGQKKKCIVHRILGSIQDEAICKVLDEKTETLKEAM